MRLKFWTLLAGALIAPACVTAQTVILPGQTPTDIQRAMSLRLSTLNWHTRCDGVTQARDKIQDTFTNAATTVPKLANRILAQYGDCAIADDVALSIVNPLVIDGSGTGATSFKCTFDGTTPILKIDGTHDVLINDLTIDVTACPGRNGIEINNSTKVKFQNVTITGGNFGFYVYGNSTEIDASGLKISGSKKGVVTVNSAHLRFTKPVIRELARASAAQAFDIDAGTDDVVIDSPDIDGAGPTRTIATCTNANPMACTSTAHGFTTGEPITIQSFTSGWGGINGQYPVTVVDPDHFTVAVNSGAFGGFVAGASAFRTTIIVGVMPWGGNAAGVLSIVGATNANPVVFTSLVPHNIPSSSYPVKVQGFTGPWGGASGTHTPTVIDATHFSVPVDTTGFPAFVVTSHNAVFRVMVAGCAPGNPTNCTRVAHGFASKQTVIANDFFGNWEPVNGAYDITVVDADHFTLPVDSTNFGTLPAGNGHVFRPLVTRVTVNNPNIRNVSNSGVFTSAGYDIKVIGGSIKNCGDVCIDAEGGAKWDSYGTVLEDCTNKCASTFFGQNGAKFSNHTVTPGNGPGQRHGIYWDDTIRAHDLNATGNIVVVSKDAASVGVAPTGIGSNVTGVERFAVTGNTVTTSGIGSGGIFVRRSNAGIISENKVYSGKDTCIGLDGSANVSVHDNRCRFLPGGTDPTAAGTRGAITNSFISSGGCAAPSTCSANNVEIKSNRINGYLWAVRYDYAGGPTLSTTVEGNITDGGGIHYRGGAGTPIKIRNNFTSTGALISPFTFATDEPGLPIYDYANNGTGNNQSGGSHIYLGGVGIGLGFGGLAGVRAGDGGAASGSWGGHAIMAPGAGNGTGVPGNVFLNTTETDVIRGKVNVGLHLTYTANEMNGMFNASACNTTFTAGDCIPAVYQIGRQASEGQGQREQHGGSYYDNAGAKAGSWFIDWLMYNQNANPKLAGMLVDAGESAASGVISFSADHNLRKTAAGPNTANVHFQIQSTGLSGVAGGTIPVKVSDPGTSYTATGTANSYALTTNWLKEAIATNSWGWIPIYYTSAITAPGGFSFFNFSTQAMELRAIAGGDLPHGSAGYLYSDGITGVGPQAIALGDLPHATDGFYKVTSGTLGIGAIALGELPHATDGCYTVTSGVLAIGACGTPTLANLPQNGNHGTLITTGSGSYTINELPPSEIDGATGPGVLMSLASGSSPVFQAVDLSSSTYVVNRLPLHNLPDASANFFLKSNGTGVDPSWAAIDLTNTTQVVNNLLYSRINGNSLTGVLFSTSGTVSIVSTGIIPRWTSVTACAANSAAAGVAGQICIDGSFFYAYNATTWKRVALSSF